MRGKRLLIVIDFFPEIKGGAEKQVFLLASRLAKGAFANVDILVLQSGCLIQDILRENDIGLFVEKISRVYSPNGFLAAWEWKERIISRGYNAVMSYHFGADLWVSFIASELRKRNIKVVSNRRDSGFWMRPSHRLLYGIAINRLFDECVYVSKSALKQWPGGCRNCVVIPNAIDLNEFNPLPENFREGLREQIGVPGDAAMLLYTASLFPLKNHALIIRAMPYLLNKGLKIKAVFAGYDRGGKDGLLSLARSLAVDKDILFLGERRDIPELISASDICVQASFSEGMSNTLLEYMAGQRPVIASDIPANREAAGDCALFVNPKDIKGFAKAVEFLINSEEEKNSIVRRAYERVREKFSIEAMTEAYFNILFKNEI